LLKEKEEEAKLPLWIRQAGYRSEAAKWPSKEEAAKLQEALDQLNQEFAKLQKNWK
jgi:hypothetical protein